MPNWVYNTLAIEGKPDVIANLIQVLAQPYTTKYTDFNGELHEEINESVFSFWNIISPPEDKLDEYFGTHGAKDGVKIGDTKYNWYNWNNRVWGCKWDASNVEEETININDETFLHTYSFSTPWAPPIPVIDILAEQYPNVVITLEFEEEQGWGGMMKWEDAQVVESYEYDIPMSHADYVEQGKECTCTYIDDPYYFYKDCPNVDTDKYEWNEEDGQWTEKTQPTTQSVE